MDPLPLFTSDFSNADVTYSLRKAFQETLNGRTYDVDLAKSIIRHEVDEDLEIERTAREVLDISDDFEKAIGKIDDVEKRIIDQQIEYITGIDKVEKCVELKEHLKLKHRDLFKILEKEFVQEFALLKADDLLPDIIQQYLVFKCFIDFRYYSTYNKCKICSKEKQEPPTLKKHIKRNQICKPRKINNTETVKIVEAFHVRPKFITFHNYVYGQTYKKTLRIVNAGCTTQSISIGQFPKNSIFFVHLESNSRLAPGMSVTATVTFQPKTNRNLLDAVVFKSNHGYTVEIPLRASRDLPELITCIFKSTCNLLNVSIPGTKTFSDSRREALNSSIDCGSCLVGQYVLMSILLQNKRMSAKFFIITEDDWFSQDVESVSTCMEINKNGFWIYPTFFEIGVDETVEMNVIFQPTKPGLHLETFFMICDNNSFEELEIMGDAMEFSKSIIEIKMANKKSDISNLLDYCIYLGNVERKSTQELILTVNNKSSLCLKCQWKFQYIPQVGIRELKEEWIKTEPVGPRYLVPYTVCSFKFEILIDAQESGYHGTHFRFFILNLPLTCLEENQEYSIIERDFIGGKTLTEAADVLISDFEVVCVVDIPPKITPQVECECESPKVSRPKVVFSESFLNIGVLPLGVDLQKKFYVQNLADEGTEWRIVEVKYNVDFAPHMEVLENDNLSCNSGIFQWRGQRQEISYNIINGKPKSNVTVLVLLTSNDPKIESICIVCYEIFDHNVTINTGHCTGPILCPLELLYVDVPTRIQFEIENHSPLTSGFYFLKPHGKDSEKISVEFDPKSSILKPFQSRTVAATIVCKEVGLFDNLTVPCFVGIDRGPIEVKVICGVDSLHVCFYLRSDTDKFKPVVWPPRVVYEFDNDWSVCQCNEEECLMFEDLSYQHTENSKIGIDSVSQENITVGNSIPTSLDESGSGIKSLEEILRENFDEEPFMLEEIVEIRNIPLNTPTKITTYIKNITPMSTTFTADVQNFHSFTNLDSVVIDCITKNEVAIWNSSIGTKYGILVQPEPETGSLKPYGLVEVNIWIFANTYGIYSEEITVDIPDVPPFSFTLLMEIIGSPVVFPMTLNSLIDHPMIRFGCIAYKHPMLERQIKIRNVSSIPLHIVWQTFLKTSKSNQEVNNDHTLSVAFDMIDEIFHPDGGRMIIFDRYLGRNTNEFCGIEPRYLNLEENSVGNINVFLDPRRFPVDYYKTHVECNLIGHIYLQESYRSKLNYFFRPTEPETNRIEIEMLAKLEQPNLTLDAICGETKLIIYANDIILNKKFYNYMHLVFRNRIMSTCEATFKIDSPFYLGVLEGDKATQEKMVTVGASGCQEIIITCFLDYQQILELSTLVYEQDEYDHTMEFIRVSRKSTKVYGSHVYHGKAIYCVDKDKKMLHIRKILRIFYFGQLEENIPIDMFIYFPNITVDPPYVKFGSVFLNSTRKAMISVSNLTGCDVKFEIYKSVNATAFYVTPHFAVIPKSTGANKESVDIFIYFTANECKAYQESIRIVTNIPKYFIEVPLSATGTVNEKFYVDHKI